MPSSVLRLLVILSHVPESEVCVHGDEADLSALVLYKTSPAANTGVYPCCEKLSSAVIDGDVRQCAYPRPCPLLSHPTRLALIDPLLRVSRYESPLAILDVRGPLRHCLARLRKADGHQIG